jgi:5,10-methylenetetrahydromethanopterin reductase
LAIHQDHLVKVTERDYPAVLEGAELLPAVTLTASAAELRERVEQMTARGIAEIAYQPAGGDIPGELERFMTAIR